MWLFWILLIVFVVVLVKALSGSGSSSPRDHPESALEILKARYARGEIDEEEYERRRRELEK
jgi:putative membrane protein